MTPYGSLQSQQKTTNKRTRIPHRYECRWSLRCNICHCVWNWFNVVCLV